MEGLKRAARYAAAGGALAMIAGAILMIVGVALASAVDDSCGELTRTAADRACRMPAYFTELGIVAVLGGMAVALAGGVATKRLRRGRVTRR